ncbi:unnamed protein product [Rotaria sp. Silwood1]|nr:unnamed protein product [Rotaria sp. Silwood1]CAF1692855.1 unnamed protein product [Rotaria sp. Silwood1]
MKIIEFVSLKKATLFAHKRIHVYLFDSIIAPTPSIAFSIPKKRLKCQAGIMVTASHNPKDNNDCKSNPEEGNETLECAIAIANKKNADFIIPTDSDADRFALTERDITGSTQTSWRILTGNQLGALLCNLPFYLSKELLLFFVN